HLALIIPGLAGLGFMLGSPGKVRRIGVLITLFVIFVTLSNAAISVEPRRIAVLAPFLSIGAAFCISSLTAWPLRRLVALAGLTGACVVLWKTTAAIPLLLPVSPLAAFDLLMAGRIAASLGLIWYLASTWRITQVEFARVTALIALILCLGIVSFASF